MTAGAPSSDSYDVVVIGSGLGGLSAAALLAKSGRRVLVAERADGPGGCAHAFQHGPYTFDPAIHFTLEAEEGGFQDSLLQHLGVRDRVDLVPLEHVYGVVFPDARLELPVHHEAFVDAHVDAFPEAGDAIRRFFGLRDELFGQIASLPVSLGLGDLQSAQEQFPLVFRYRNATLGAVLDEFFDDVRVRGALTAIWPYFTNAPSRLSFVWFIQFLSVLVKGPAYSLGGFQRLADAYVAAVEENGGEFAFESPVVKVNLEGEAVTGVVLEGDRTISAPVVVANADARHTLEDLVGVDRLPDSYVKRVRRLKPTLSGFVLYCTTQKDFREYTTVNETFVYDDWDHERTHRRILEGHPGGVWVTVPSLVDRSLGPPGEHLVIVSSLASYELERPWAEETERFTDELLGTVERAFPGLTNGLAVLRTATPERLEEATRTHRGALYGWDYSPAQFGNKRLAHDTPIRGLYLSGQWATEGGSSFRVTLSGVRTASQVAQDIGLGDVIPSFRPADLPEAAFG